MTTYDAKNRLSELLDAVVAGETIEITRRGRAIARLSPMPAIEPRFADPAAAARWLREHRSNVRPEPIRRLIEEGRR